MNAYECFSFLNSYKIIYASFYLLLLQQLNSNSLRIIYVVSEAAVNCEAEELEMQTDRYIQNLQQALTEMENSTTYSFSLIPSPPEHSSTVTLAYEKVQKDISVSKSIVVRSISVW